MPVHFNLIFHGPWGFVVDDYKKTIRAYTPDCKGHQYLMGEDRSDLQPMAGGTYKLAHAADVTTTLYDEDEVKQTLWVTQHSRFEFPAADDKRLHCAFELPLTGFRGLRPADRGEPQDGYDDLLSGRNFRHLSVGPLALHQVLHYKVPGRTKAALRNGRAIWRAKPGTGAVNLKIYAQSVTPGGEDHFAMMAALFNYDLHLDGDQVVGPAPPMPLQADLTDGVRVADLQDLDDGANSSRTYKFPIACGGGLVVFYKAI